MGFDEELVTTCLVPLLEQGGGCAFSADLAWVLCKDVFLAKEGGSGSGHPSQSPSSSTDATAALKASWQRCWDVLLRLGWLCNTNNSIANLTTGGSLITEAGAPASSSLLSLSGKLVHTNTPPPPPSSLLSLSRPGVITTTVTLTIASLAAITSHPMSVEDGCPVAVDRVRQVRTGQRLRLTI